MHLVKKIEIIADTSELGKLTDKLDKAGVRSYAVIRNVAGKGLQGIGEDVDVTMLDNVYILAFCPPEHVKTVMEHIRPLLNKFGGTCYLSDVMEVRSIRCVASL